MTYSIVARDPETGQMGVAVQSHYFSVGSIVTWAEAGVGAVATQSFAEPSYGPFGLGLMRAGKTPEETLQALVGIDEDEERRQVAMLAATGAVAVHTGSMCIPEAGHATGDGVGVQANMMLRASVWPAMLAAFSATTGDVAARMMAALDAAEAEGGDIRGRQSAAMLVVNAERTGKPWVDRALEVRIEDHADPLGELRRMIAMRRAVDEMDRAEKLVLSGDVGTAADLFARSQAAFGSNVEPSFWAGVSLAGAGDVEKAREAIAPALRAHEGWRELLRRLPAVGLLPDEPDVLERLLAP